MTIPSPLTTDFSIAENPSAPPDAAGPALSTSCRPEGMGAGALVKMLGRLGVRRVELEYRIPDTMLHPLREALLSAGIAVVSVHNFFPFPTRYQKRMRPDGDLFCLSAVDPEERALAIQWTRRTIELAHELEAGRVVLHCGRVDMAPAVDELHRRHRQGSIDAPEAEALRAVLADRRAQRLPPHLDALKFSLEALLDAAQGLGVRLGLENRYHHHELPGPGDFEDLFRTFDGAPIGYWHDTGHAHAAEQLGWCAPGELIGKWKGRLVGVHLHDAEGLDDHRPPGAGDVDFTPFADLAPDIPKVVELRPGTPEAAAAAGLAQLKKLFEPAGR